MSPLPVLDIDREISQRGVPVSAQNTYRRALGGSRPSAVKAMCLECQGWEDGARQAIRDCPSLGCPLHAVRPFQKKTGASTEIDTDADEREDNDDGSGNANVNVNALADVKSKILDHLHRHGESTRGYIVFSTGIPESLWSDAIRELLSENEIERIGEKRSTRYRFKESH